MREGASRIRRSSACPLPGYARGVRKLGHRPATATAQACYALAPFDDEVSSLDQAQFTQALHKGEVVGRIEALDRADVDRAKSMAKCGVLRGAPRRVARLNSRRLIIRSPHWRAKSTADVVTPSAFAAFLFITSSYSVGLGKRAPRTEGSRVDIPIVAA